VRNNGNFEAQPGNRARGIDGTSKADIKGFFDHVDHDGLIKCLEQRIKDPVFLRLISRFLKAGVMEDGVQWRTESGTPQGRSGIACVGEHLSALCS
jgi:hypothetical protein